MRGHPQLRGRRRVACPECGARRRDIWRHFRLAHPTRTFEPIGEFGRHLWWSVGWQPGHGPLDRIPRHA